MLTKLTLRNFKQFVDVEIELGNPAVFIGPNDSGKTSALQALALWHLGVRRWSEKRRGAPAPERRPGVAVNRRDLVSIPVPDANLLWLDLHVRDVQKQNGKQRTSNVRIDIIVEGVDNGHAWTCGLEFDYANDESFYCRPLRLSEDKNPDRMPIPREATDIVVSFLPPMSGLAANETRLDPGAINVRLGEGRTAEVLRNLCFQISEEKPTLWQQLSGQIEALFGLKLDAPEYVSERGEVVMTFRTQSGVRLDLSSSGRGFQQTLLLLSYITMNPGSVLLLDEPDAHLEILRQKQIYQVLTEAARQHQCQVIAASHSEVILNEAADRDVVIAFLGKPHRIDDRGFQLGKALKEIGFEHYYQAEITGWVLYLEGPTDLAILRALARTLDHKAQESLERPFVKYVQNLPQRAKDHFFGLREAKPDLVGFALFDRLNSMAIDDDGLRAYKWQKREIENYICQRDVLLRWALQAAGGNASAPLFGAQWSDVMEKCIDELEKALKTARRGSPWGDDIKASDEFLDPLFENFFSAVGLPNLMRKTDYHRLAEMMRPDECDPEITTVLDSVVDAQRRAVPRTSS
jgi:ABC-type branched-subunit amino acid transport system ATPase component